MGRAAVIMLDTHVWVWWLHDDPALPQSCRDIIAANQADGLGVSVLSCWEVAMLVAKGRLRLTIPVAAWVSAALSPPEVRLLELTPSIAIASTVLPGSIHSDPADRIIVATARGARCPLLTLDQRIRQYPHVSCLP
jgi:PIN domain nuclease of toxin-antitoxin system